MGRDSLEYANIPVDAEIEVLRILNGEDIPGWTWGAAMTACCESLKSMGLAKNYYEITEKGKNYLDNLNKS